MSQFLIEWFLICETLLYAKYAISLSESRVVDQFGLRLQRKGINDHHKRLYSIALYGAYVVDPS